MGLFNQQNQAIMPVKPVLQLMLADHSVKALVIAFPTSSLLIQRQPDGQLLVSNHKPDSPSPTLLPPTLPSEKPNPIRLLVQTD